MLYITSSLTTLMRMWSTLTVKEITVKNGYSNENLRLTEFQEIMHHWLPGLTTDTRLVLKTVYQLHQMSCCQKIKCTGGNKKTASCQTCHLKKRKVQFIYLTIICLSNWWAAHQANRTEACTAAYLFTFAISSLGKSPMARHLLKLGISLDNC